MECAVNLSIRSARVDDPHRTFYLRHAWFDLTDHRGTVVVDINVSESVSGGGNGGGPVGQSAEDAAPYAFGVTLIELTFLSQQLDPDSEVGSHAVRLLSMLMLPPEDGAHLLRVRYTSDLWRIYVIQGMQWAPDWVTFDVEAVS